MVKWTWRALLQDRNKFESLFIICLTSLSFFLLALWGRHTVSVFCFSEVDLPLKKDGFTSESTTLEALLRGEGIEKKTDTKEEDTIQEIQVKESPMPWHQGWILQFVLKFSSLLSCGRTVHLLTAVSFYCQNVIKPLCYTVMLKMMSVSHMLLSQESLLFDCVLHRSSVGIYFAALWDNYVENWEAEVDPNYKLNFSDSFEVSLDMDFNLDSQLLWTKKSLPCLVFFLIVGSLLEVSKKNNFKNCDFKYLSYYKWCSMRNIASSHALWFESYLSRFYFILQQLKAKTQL